MSSASALATVTATLQHLLSQSTSADLVSTLPPAVARDPDNAVNQINVFLYKMEVNTAFSNFPVPNGARANESAPPPLALTLRYLLTCYGQDDDDIPGQRVMGESMLALHDHMVLSRQMIDGMLSNTVLHHQVERVRITHDPISTDELTRLWGVFHTGYRLSQAYEVSVAILESDRPANAPLPVLRRGADDRGVAVQPSVDPPFPWINEIELPGENREVVAGETLLFRGSRLNAAAAAIRFSNIQHNLEALIPAATIEAESITVQLPAAGAALRVGIYRVQAELTDAGTTRHTNSLSLLIAPQISNLQLDGSASNRELTLDVSPIPAEGQSVLLLLSALSLGSPLEIAPGRLRFVLGGITDGEYVVRLRVDGIDSRFIDRMAQPPVFLPASRISIP